MIVLSGGDYGEAEKKLDDKAQAMAWGRHRPRTLGALSAIKVIGPPRFAAATSLRPYCESAQLSSIETQGTGQGTAFRSLGLKKLEMDVSRREG